MEDDSNKSRRDDFTSKTKDNLAKRVAFLSSNPNCMKQTMGPHINPEKIVNIGVACHITAASTGGPRYDSEISDIDRKSANNGIWLCQSCAKLIDSDADKFTVEMLRDWKQRAEKHANNSLQGNNKKEIDRQTIRIDDIGPLGILEQLNAEGYRVRWFKPEKMLVAKHAKNWEDCVCLLPDGQKVIYQTPDGLILLKKRNNDA